MAAGASERGLSSVTMTASAKPRGDRAHDRPLAGVAVAAAAEHHHQPPLRQRPQGGQHLSPARRACARSRRRPAPGRADPRAASRPGAPSSVASAASTASAGLPVAMHSPAATSAFETWKSPASGRRARIDRPATSSVRDTARLSGRASMSRRVWPARPTVTTLSPRLKQAATTAGAASLSASIDGRATRRQQHLEQAQLGLEIGVQRAVIVEVVARQVGEGAGGEADAVQALLLDAVATRLPAPDA